MNSTSIRKLINTLILLLAGSSLYGCKQKSLNKTPEVVSADTTARAPFSITGRVFEANSRVPLANAVILINDARGVQLLRYDRIVSDKNGSFTVGNLAHGPYRLRAFYKFDFNGAYVQVEMLSGRIYVDESGEFADMYFSKSEAHTRFKARMKHLNQQNPITEIRWWIQTLRRQQKDLVLKGFYVNDDYQLRHSSYQVYVDK